MMHRTPRHGETNAVPTHPTNQTLTLVKKLNGMDRLMISYRARLYHGNNLGKMEESDSYSFLHCNTVWNKRISSNHST
jgi:hypothetical protein